MRFAVISDVHGNLAALEAVVADISAHAPDLVINLGDHVSGPLQAGATADFLIARREWVQIRGNHDRQLSEQPPDHMGLSDRAAYEQLSAAQRQWLLSLAPAAKVLDDVLLCHGTPDSDVEYLVEDVSPSGVSLAGPAAIRSRLGCAATATLCGHSHRPHFGMLENGAIAVNPGSVGLQAYYDREHRFPHVIETGSPHARYVLLDRVGRRRWRATFRLVDYDWDAVAQLALRRGRAEWAHALATGYAQR